MSGFTPRSWKSQAEPQTQPHADPVPERLPSHSDRKNDNLPVVRTAFIGREHDVAAVKAMLSEHGLVTLVGSGGIGKTRLAVQVGNELLESSPDGVWLVELAPIADPELVSSVIAQTLGMNQQEGHRIDEAIPSWLARKQLLLILDNCEHVLDTIAPIAAAILRAAPDVRILATSRQALDIGDEKVVRVPSLDVPHAIADLGANQVIAFAAVALFVARATMVDTSFALTDDTAPIVADICRRLDGIPLAIELAAARVKVLSIPHLAERLNERFKLLTSSSRDVMPRQKTLHALIDWSYDLLTPQEQLLFARLGIFASGFALDAATHVCGGEGLDELDILDLLGSLTDKSLVVANTSGEHERYRLLESTAAYALEKLRASEEHDTLARRHAAYYRDLAVAAGERYGTGSTFAWMAIVELELENFRSALAWALTYGNDAVLGGEIAGALASLWDNAGLAVEGLYWIERALEVVSEIEQPHVAAGLHVALAAFFSGKRLRDASERAIQLYGAAGDARGIARAQRDLAMAHFQMGELDTARANIAEAMAAMRASGDALGIGKALNTQAIVEQSQGNNHAARERWAEALEVFKALGNESGAALVLGNIAEVEFAAGHLDRALSAAGDVLEMQQRGNSAGIAVTYVNGAAYRLALEDLPGAREWAREGLRTARQVRYELGITIAFQHLALLAALTDDGRRAAQLLGYVEARYGELGNKREYTEQWSYDKLLVALRETLTEDEIARLMAEGATWSEDRAAEEAP